MSCLNFKMCDRMMYNTDFQFIYWANILPVRIKNNKFKTKLNCQTGVLLQNISDFFFRSSLMLRVAKSDEYRLTWLTELFCAA